MPARTFATLLVSVIAAAGLTVAVVSASGLGLVWVGLAALLLSLAIRAIKW